MEPQNIRRHWRGVSPELRRITQQHREQLTAAEERLWNALRGKSLDGLRFRCQHAWETFIFDFYCASAQLIVEVDGGYHDQPDQREKDRFRDAHLTACGFVIVRVTNDEVFHELSIALERIRQAARNSPRRAGASE